MKCKFCKRKFEPARPLQQFCSYECAISQARINGLKKMEEVQKIKREAMKESIKSLSDYKRELQKEVNLIARLIDQDCPCISSGRTTGKMNGGHRYAVGGWDNLRFNLFNIWIQSEADNTHKHGNPSGYDKQLTDFGLYEYIHDLNAIYPRMKWNKEELKEAIKTAKKCVKDLIKLNQSEQIPRTIERRVELRKDFNIILNIYI
jgi:hypothetical protein